MGGHRGEAVVKRLTPMALREMGIAFGCAMVGGTAWAMFAKSNHKTWQNLNKEYQNKKIERRKNFEAWLAAQPYDDESK